MTAGWRDPRPKGRRLEPIEAFEVTPWRAMIVFRFATLAYAIGLTAHNNWRYPHRAAAWVVIGVMVVWTVLASLAYERARLRAWPMLLVDLAVTAGCVLATLPIVGERPAGGRRADPDHHLDGLPGAGGRGGEGDPVGGRGRGPRSAPATSACAASSPRHRSPVRRSW